jgi:alpha-ribazole phosphatase
MRIYLVRHPQPEVASGVCYGSTDLAVSAHERVSVLAALTAMLPADAPVFSSPLRRCAELAESLAAALGCAKVIHDARLVEMHFGEWEMRAWADIPRAEVDAWMNDLAAHRPGGGESLIEMAQRIRSFHDDLRQRKQEHAVVVCHAGTIRLLRACRPDLSLADMARDAAQSTHKIAFGETLVLDW